MTGQPPNGDGIPPPPPPPGWWQPEMGGVPRTEPMATWSLVCGIAGFVICGAVLGVAAIVLANNAQRKIAASNGTLTGYGLARAGRILGIIAAVVGIAVLAIFVNQR